MKNKPFKDPIAYSARKAMHPVVDNIFNFAAPTKEEATTGRYMSAGDNYGIGFNQPVGKFEASNANCPIPEESKCFHPDQAIR